MQDGSIFRDVDFLAAEHGVDPRPQIALLGQLHEQLERLVGDAMLRVIEENARRLGCHPLATPRVVGEERTKVQVPNRFKICFERFPRRARGEQ